MNAYATPLFHVLVWAAIGEFLLLRVFLRLGPVLPGREALLPVYQVVETLGLAALNLAMLAAVGLLAVVALALDWRRRGSTMLAGALLAAGALSIALGAVSRLLPAPLTVVGHAVLLLVATGMVAALASLPTRARGLVGLVAAAQGLALYQVLTQGMVGFGMELPGAGMTQFAAEAVAVVVALALPWCLRVRPTRHHLIVGLLVALAFFAAQGGRPWTVATLTMWTVAFSLFLPAVLYAAALGVGTSTLLALRAAPGGPAVAAGLLLVALAGLKPDFTYFAVLGLAGLVATCQALPVHAAAGVPRAATDGQGAAARLAGVSSWQGDLVRG